jgi:hypothetical protein
VLQLDKPAVYKGDWGLKMMGVDMGEKKIGSKDHNLVVGLYFSEINTFC